MEHGIKFKFNTEWKAIKYFETLKDICDYRLLKQSLLIKQKINIALLFSVYLIYKNSSTLDRKDF